jgi:hypothetical protein
VLKLDNNNQTEIELEEAFLQTTGLPFGLQLKGGQFFDAFGRINATHPHTWEFADSPLVNGRLLGPDGLRGVGAQISWTLPTPWYAQLIFAVQNGRGGTAYSFRNPGDNGVFYDRMTIDRDASALHDMLYVPRFETSFNPSDTQTVLLGASGAFGMNDTGSDEHTQIYGADFLYKWKSSHAEGGFPFVKWQTEAMYRASKRGAASTIYSQSKKPSATGASIPRSCGDSRKAGSPESGAIIFTCRNPLLRRTIRGNRAPGFPRT